MIPSEYTDTIEAVPFVARIGVVSLPRQFKDAIKSEPVVRNLFASIASRSVREELVERIEKLRSLLYKVIDTNMGFALYDEIKEAIGWKDD